MRRYPVRCDHDSAHERLLDFVSERLDTNEPAITEARCEICGATLYAEVSVWPDGKLRGRIWDNVSN